ncbi:MAG: argininosuccinate lyase [Candidatus Omnitrophota bacterium]
MKKISKKLWGGRFKKGIDRRLQAFSYSLGVDHQLFDAELRVDEAYAKMLAKIGILSRAELARLLRGLESLRRTFHKEDFLKRVDSCEDVHTLIQEELEKKAGPAAKKLHTGRSRNDLVVTSTKIFLRGKIQGILDRLSETQKSLLACAKKTFRAVLPGFTHLRKAQPVLLAHHFLAYVEMFGEDRDRLEAAAERMNVLPLGSAALGGSSLPIDQKFLARELGFSKIASNSMAAVSDRAFLVEIQSGLATLWMHLSRLAEDMILWNSEPFHFVELDDSFATGSSLMPQKKNPDLFELIRGKSAGMTGTLVSLLTMQKGLPLTYNRDLQEDKPGLFRAILDTEQALSVLPAALASMMFNLQAMRAACQDDSIFSTDILEYLVTRGVPFREAHQCVGQIVRYASDRKMRMKDLSLERWRCFSPKFGKDVLKIFDPLVSVGAKKTFGSTGPRFVRKQIQEWTRRLFARGRSRI